MDAAWTSVLSASGKDDCDPNAWMLTLARGSRVVAYTSAVTNPDMPYAIMHETAARDLYLAHSGGVETPASLGCASAILYLRFRLFSAAGDRVAANHMCDECIALAEKHPALMSSRHASALAHMAEWRGFLDQALAHAIVARDLVVLGDELTEHNQAAMARNVERLRAAIAKRDAPPPPRPWYEGLCPLWFPQPQHPQPHICATCKKCDANKAG